MVLHADLRVCAGVLVLGRGPGCGDHISSSHPMLSVHLPALYRACRDAGEQGKYGSCPLELVVILQQKTGFKQVMRKFNENGHLCYVEVYGVQESTPRLRGRRSLDSVTLQLCLVGQAGAPCGESGRSAVERLEEVL